MRFDVTPIEDRLILVTLEGKLDGAGAEVIGTPFTAALSGGGADAMLDLGQVPFMGSLGIRLLLSVARVMHRRGTKMVLFGATGPVAEVLEVAALDAIIPQAADQAAARALLRG